MEADSEGEDFNQADDDDRPMPALVDLADSSDEEGGVPDEDSSDEENDFNAAVEDWEQEGLEAELMRMIDEGSLPSNAGDDWNMEFESLDDWSMAVERLESLEDPPPGVDVEEPNPVAVEVEGQNVAADIPEAPPPSNRRRYQPKEASAKRREDRLDWVIRLVFGQHQRSHLAALCDSAGFTCSTQLTYTHHSGCIRDISKAPYQNFIGDGKSLQSVQ